MKIKQWYLVDQTHSVNGAFEVKAGPFNTRDDAVKQTYSYNFPNQCQVVYVEHECKY